MNSTDNPPSPYYPSKSHKSLLPEIGTIKTRNSPVFMTNSMPAEKFRQKKAFMRAPQSDIKQWQKDWERINKEEMAVRRNIKAMNAKYQQVMVKFHESLQEKEPGERKQKELERSLIMLDGLLKGIKKKGNLN
jgi:hypothetical protein